MDVTIPKTHAAYIQDSFEHVFWKALRIKRFWTRWIFLAQPGKQNSCRRLLMFRHPIDALWFWVSHQFNMQRSNRLHVDLPNTRTPNHWDWPWPTSWDMLSHAPNTNLTLWFWSSQIFKPKNMRFYPEFAEHPSWRRPKWHHQSPPATRGARHPRILGALRSHRAWNGRSSWVSTHRSETSNISSGKQ